MDAYDGCIPVTVYMVQKYVGGSIFGRWVNICLLYTSDAADE